MNIDMGQPEKLALVGDSHGDLDFMKEVIEEAADAGVDTLFQLGDFGYWPAAKIPDREHPGDRFLLGLDLALERRGMRLLWLRGNHENHDQLEPGMQTARTQHVPDGHRWKWWGKTWMVVGGGVSVDKSARTPGYDWFPQETLSPAQFEHCMRPGNVDVVLAHDAPDQVDIPGLASYQFPVEAIWESEAHRQVLGRICDEKRPQLWVHGHYHKRYTRGRMTSRTLVCGLACNLDKREDAVLYLTEDSP